MIIPLLILGSNISCPSLSVVQIKDEIGTKNEAARAAWIYHRMQASTRSHVESQM